MRPRALVFDLYGEYFRHTGGAARLGALTELMGVFDVEPATVRVVMTRLRREGWFNSTKTGREVSYLLNDKSWRLLEDGRKRIFWRSTRDWDRTWTQALVDTSEMNREQRKRVEQALTWWGFGNYDGPAWFSPHDRRKQLCEMLTGDDERRIRFLRSTGNDLFDDRLIAQQCWNLSELDADYQDFIDEYRPRLSSFRRLEPGSTALVEQLTLMQSYRRYPLRDPDLPDVLLPAGWCGRIAHEVFTESHDTLGAAATTFVAEVAGHAIGFDSA